MSATPPGSGEREVNVIVEESRDDYATYGANWDVMRAEGDEPNPEPDSGEREVMRDDCQLCLGARGGVPGNENLIRVCDYCHADLLAGFHKDAFLLTPLPLAQRILAALESYAVPGRFPTPTNLHALADELRKEMGRNG